MLWCCIRLKRWTWWSKGNRHCILLNRWPCLGLTLFLVFAFTEEEEEGDE